MKKHNLKEIREWLAIPKNGDESFEFTLNDIYKADEGEGGIYNSSTETWYDLSKCHICDSTGYTDSEDEKSFDGSLVQCYSRVNNKTTYWIVKWDDDSWVMEFLPLPNSSQESDDIMCSDFFIADGDSYKITIIGHICIESEWSPEMRKLLK